MVGSTISSLVTHPVTISSDGYLSPLLITNTGTISLGWGTEATALKIDNPPAVATITNDGLIQANAAPEDGGFGIAVYSRATITNNGVIRGGTGYPYVYNYYGNPNFITGMGGAGIIVNASTANSTILDTGKIYGGSGHLFDGQTGYSGAGVELFTSHVKMTVSRTGTIAGGYGGSAYGNRFAGDGIVMGIDTLDNSGLIIGGAGGGYPAHAYGGFPSNPKVGLIGGIGVLAEGGLVLNRGAIAGGAGGSLDEVYGGRGGTGLVVSGAISGADKDPYAFIVNLGTIEGGNGGDGSNIGADGGVGVILEENSVLANHGHIVGGAAGVGGVAGSADGGAGVSIYSTATLLNSGEITAGAGYGVGVIADGGIILNAGAINGADGGDGIRLGGASLVNTGVIAGGAGVKGGVGVYSYGRSTLINSGIISGGIGSTGDSGRGDAVVLNGPNAQYASTLIVENGAAFNGDVVANPADSDVLELAGTSNATLTGIGTKFTGFDNIAFANGARWTIAGDIAGLASGQEITGFRPGDAITITDAAASSGAVSVATAGVVSIDAGGVICKLDIAGATVGETDFTFSNYTLTESTRPAMAFLPPPATAAAPTPADPFSNLDVLQHFVAASPTPALFGQATLTAAPTFGANLNQFRATHIDSVPLVTLQA